MTMEYGGYWSMPGSSPSIQCGNQWGLHQLLMGWHPEGRSGSGTCYDGKTKQTRIMLQHHGSLEVPISYNYPYPIPNLFLGDLSISIYHLGNL